MERPAAERCGVSKKPQRSRHRTAPVPWSTAQPVQLDEAYEREVERSTEKLVRQYTRALKRVQQVEAKLRAAREQLQAPRPSRRAPKKHTMVELELELEARRAELEEFRRMMVSVPASAAHRGTSSYRPVPIGDQGAF